MTSSIHRQRISAAPTIVRAYWSFAMTGLVRHPVVWAYDDLMALPMQRIQAPIVCSVGNPSSAIRSVEWRGIPLSTLLSTVELGANAAYARIHSADGYTTLVTRDALEAGLLVLEADGVPLTVEDGAPARLMFPGRLGYKQAKWVERVDWLDQPSGGLWEERGYAIDGAISVGIAGVQSNRIQRAVEVTGQVYSAVPTQNVLISIEGGDWMPTQVESSHTDDSGIHFTNWSIRWMPPHSGIFSARIRALAENTPEAALTYQIRVS